MRVRLVTEADTPAILALGRQMVAEVASHHVFDDEVARETIRASLTTATPTCFVVEQAGAVIGFLYGFIHGYSFTAGISVVQEVLYVRPDKRGTRAAALLILAFKRWGEGLDAKEIVFGISSGINVDRAARLFERFGAQRTGYWLRIARGPDGWEC